MAGATQDNGSLSELVAALFRLRCNPGLVLLLALLGQRIHEVGGLGCAAPFLGSVAATTNVADFSAKVREGEGKERGAHNYLSHNGVLRARGEAVAALGPADAREDLLEYRK